MTVLTLLLTNGWTVMHTAPDEDHRSTTDGDPAHLTGQPRCIL
jgi:hypothetical protein